MQIHSPISKVREDSSISQYRLEKDGIMDITMNEQERDALYYSTDFAKRLAKIRENPEILNTKEKLVDFWKLALRDRNNNKSIQEFIATEAARETGMTEYENVEDDPYMAVIMQFHLMDYMSDGVEADKEWAKLTDMLSKLKNE